MFSDLNAALWIGGESECAIGSPMTAQTSVDPLMVGGSLDAVEVLKT